MLSTSIFVFYFSVIQLNYSFQAISMKRSSCFTFKLNMEYDYTGLVNDMTTVFVSNTVSDVIAQITEKRQLKLDNVEPSSTLISTSSVSNMQVSSLSSLLASFDFDRTKRFALFGIVDGAFGHNWFLILDYFIKGSQNVDVFYKVIADITIFTPIWCVWFLVVMGLLEGSLFNKFKENKFRTEYRELLFIDLGFFIPVSIIVYSLVARENRVLAFAIANLVYTSIISVWNQNNMSDLDKKDVIS